MIGPGSDKNHDWTWRAQVSITKNCTQDLNLLNGETQKFNFQCMTNTTGTLGFQPPDIEPMAGKGVDEGTQSLERCESQTADRRQILRTTIKTFRSQTVDLSLEQRVQATQFWRTGNCTLGNPWSAMKGWEQELEQYTRTTSTVIVLYMKI